MGTGSRDEIRIMMDDGWKKGGKDIRAYYGWPCG